MAITGVILGMAAVILAIVGFVIVHNAVNNLNNGMQQPAIEQVVS